MKYFKVSNISRENAQNVYAAVESTQHGVKILRLHEIWAYGGQKFMVWRIGGKKLFTVIKNGGKTDCFCFLILDTPFR